MSKNFGYDSSVLAAGINAGSRAVSDMSTVKQQVQQITDQILLVNKSTSGGMLTSRFSEWNGHFQKLTAKLDELNTKVIMTAKANTQTGDDADVVAS